jgi:diaminopimelate decarboxylase
LGAERDLAIAEGELLAIHSAGAYGMAQASNYNSRSRAAEVMVVGETFRTIRQRETIRDQLALELTCLTDQPDQAS